MAGEQNAMDPQAQQSLTRFMAKLEAEGGYSTQQILSAASMWMERYNRGIRDDTALESGARVALDQPVEVTETVEEFPDEMTFNLRGTEGPNITGENLDNLTAYLDRLRTEEGYTGDQLAEAGQWWVSEQEGLPEQVAPAPADLSGGMDAEALIADIETGPPSAPLAEFGAEVFESVEEPVPAYRNEDAAARLAARNAQTPTAPTALPAAEDGGFLDNISVTDKLGLGMGLAGTALGIMAPGLERDKGFEGQLKERAAGNTIARKEGDLAAGQLARSIASASIGRRDISPALAMRNAQMAGARAGSNVMAQAAIASARERQAAQQQLADIRKARVSSQINAGMAGLASTGAWLSSQGAAQKQDARYKEQLAVAQERNRLMAQQNELAPPPRNQRKRKGREYRPGSDGSWWRADDGVNWTNGEMMTLMHPIRASR